jgi:hypothetical protein
VRALTADTRDPNTPSRSTPAKFQECDALQVLTCNTVGGVELPAFPASQEPPPQHSTARRASTQGSKQETAVHNQMPRPCLLQRAAQAGPVPAGYGVNKWGASVVRLFG